MTRVRVVDDNGDSCTSLVMLCKIWGHETASAGDGREALAVWATFAPDVIVLDLGLPGVDGWAVARRIPAEAGSDVYIIALSGYGQAADRARAREVGCDEFLLKPANLDELRDMLNVAPARVATRTRKG